MSTYIILFLVILGSAQAQSNDIVKILKIGSHVNHPKHENTDFHVFSQPLYFSSIPDVGLSVCFLLVIGYLTYIVISFMIPFKVPQSGMDPSKNPALHSLLAKHHFRDNGMPAKMRNLFDSDKQFEQSYIGSYNTPCTPVHSTPVKKSNKILQL